MLSFSRVSVSPGGIRMLSVSAGGISNPRLTALPAVGSGTNFLIFFQFLNKHKFIKTFYELSLKIVKFLGTKKFETFYGQLKI